MTKKPSPDTGEGANADTGADAPRYAPYAGIAQIR